MIAVRSIALCLAIPALAALSPVAHAQSCYTQTSLGGAAAVNLITALERVGTSPANMNAVENDGADSSSYAVANFAGVAGVTAATALVSGSLADNDDGPFGVTFINGTANPVTVTQVDVTADRTKAALFRSAPKPVGLGPIDTWTWIDGWTVRWTGTLVVPPKSGQGFIVEPKISNAAIDIPNTNVGGTITTSIGTFVGQPFPTDVFVPDRKFKVATGVIGFDVAGTFPRTFIPGLIGGVSNTISLRIQEYANNQSIAAGLELTVSIPPQWSNVSLVSAPPPFDAASVVIVQPTSSTPGSFKVTTNSEIGKGSTTPLIQFAATPPQVYTDSTFLMRASLNGWDTSSPAHPIRSVCDGGGVVQPGPGSGGGGGVEVEFLSPSLTPHAPVLGTQLRADFNVIDGVGGETIAFDVFNVTTSSWETITTQTPGAANATSMSTFAATDVPDYLDASNRMRVRFRSVATTTPHTLRIDHLAWTADLGWVVDSALGSDAFPGNARSPFLSIGQALSVVGGSEVVYVRLGNSRSGQPYGPNLEVSNPAAAGSAGCKTLIQGIPDPSGNLPLIVGNNPYGDFGFAAGADHVKLDRFEVRNTQVGLYSVPGTTGTVFSNSLIEVPASAYGILGYNSAGAVFERNRVRSVLGNSMVGIWDFGGSGTLLRENVSTGFSGGGVAIWSYGTSAPRLERNIAAGSYIGIHVAHTSGTAELFNNVSDSNGYMGIYAESPSTLVARNNSVTRNGIGWRWNGSGSVSTNFDDVWSNGTDYLNVSAGPNSISADPLYIQTVDPTLATYYQPGPGSPCIDAGIDVGLPYSGTAPDLGAVETP